MEQAAQNPQEKIVRTFDDSAGSSNRRTILLFAGVVLLGLLTGILGARFQGGPTAVSTDGGTTSTAVEEAAKKGEIIGSADESAFKDSAEGKLVPGGIEGEGAFHLERPGGESQNVYLTSSVIDLSKFVDRKVKVWGETFQGQRAGWLMDVGRLQVLD